MGIRLSRPAGQHRRSRALVRHSRMVRRTSLTGSGTRIGTRAASGLLAVSVLAFLIIRAVPSDPVILAIQAWNLPPTDEVISGLRHEWGLDRPLLLQYLGWLGRFVRGDWGTSFRTGAPIADEFLRRLPLSLGIGLGGLVLAAALSVPIGYRAACRPGGLIDSMSRALATGAQAVPAFWLGLILLWLLAAKWRLMRPFADHPGTLALAIGLIAFASLGSLARVYRRALVDVEGQPFFRTALAKGLSRDQALWRHGGRHAIYALLASLRAEAGWAIGGTATVEVLIGLPGISQFLVQSIAARDYLVLQAYVMVVAIWMTAMNAVVTVLHRRLDPRVDPT